MGCGQPVNHEEFLNILEIGCKNKLNLRQFAQYLEDRRIETPMRTWLYYPNVLQEYLDRAFFILIERYAKAYELGHLFDRKKECRPEPLLLDYISKLRCDLDMVKEIVATSWFHMELDSFILSSGSGGSFSKDNNLPFHHREIACLTSQNFD